MKNQHVKGLKGLLLAIALVAVLIPVKAMAAGAPYNTYKGLQMYGYQGWFNAQGDGADKGWTHYSNGGKFEPGYVHIDFWPDVSEYSKKYLTSFKFSDGSGAYVFSAYDESTVDTHFRWMKEYGQDGAFMQRFTHSIRETKVKNHYMKVFDSAVKAATKYGRAISIRYDITSGSRDDYQDLLADLDELNGKYNFFSRSGAPTFLHHNGKPLIAIGGIGWDDDGAEIGDRGYLREARYIIDGLKSRGYSILIRVPYAWRVGGGQLVTSTALKDEFYKQILRGDIIMPWHVGAYREDSYLNTWPERIREDINWAKARGKDYVPVIYPGFSRYNLENRVDDGSYRPRNKGSFYWLQASRAMNVGAEMLFLAQFDEMDEGTQFFKVSQKVPVGASPFRIYDDVKNDHYLWLAGESGKMLRGEKAYTTTLPTRPSGTASSCYIDSPSGNVTKKVGESLYVKVSGSDSDGVERVKLYLNGIEYSSDSAAPYEWNVPFTQTGTFVLTAKVKDLLGNFTDSGNSVTVSVGSTGVTLLNEGFENGFGNWTNELWQTTTAYKNSGSYSAVAGDTSNNLYGKDLNTASYNKITISFSYRDGGVDADDDVYLMLYDGSTWVNAFELGLATENTWVSKTITLTKSTSPQYFKSNFKLRFRGNSIDTGEKLWLDDIKVTAE